MNSEFIRSSPRSPSLRAQGKAPVPDYIIKPAASSLIGDIPALRDDPERTKALAVRMVEKYGARRSRERPDAPLAS